MADSAEPIRNRKKSRGRNAEVMVNGNDQGFRQEALRAWISSRSGAKETKKQTFACFFAVRDTGIACSNYFGAGFLPLDFFFAAMVGLR